MIIYRDHDDIVPKTAVQRAALEQIARIDADPQHPSKRPDHPDCAAALDEKCALWAVVLGDNNDALTTYR